ncbi:hypothetical protein [Laspinema olomoucense]|uniref:Chromosome partition protein Smc n=1 Tax=Laspinema olomoucense D3b TaxID=2953688 RepID=A0ABT2N1L9_9CYAN|nr:hypothetical protein [Laspinema sp. D3b]MCT7976583.1 hypothetical protein [Laspinema sp. D3b]
MSGRKERYVSISEADLRRLQEQDSRLRSVQQDLPDRLNRMRAEANREMQQRLLPLEQRAKQQEQEAQRLRSNLGTLERETQQRLRIQREDFQQAVRESEVRQQQALLQEGDRLTSAMRAGFEKQRTEYLRITADQRQEYLTLNQQLNQKFSELLEEERQARETGQQMLQQQIDRVFDSLEQERLSKAKLAQELLTDVEQIWQQIDRDYQHQRFAPNQLADLRRNLELAKQNLAAGVFEAAIATSQDTYLKLADLRLQLEQKEQEWLLYYTTTLEDLRSLISEVQAHRQIEIELGEAGGAVETFQEEVDYWTDGRLSAYHQKLDKFHQELTEGQSTLTTQQIQELAQQIEALRPELADIAHQAKMQVILSQMRAEIADNVVEMLESYGYQLADPNTDASYEGADYRNAYVVKVKNIAGEEVVTVITPEKELGANNISINAFSDRLLDEEQLRQRAEGIFNALHEESGLELQGQTQCYEQPQAEYRDIEQVKHRQTKPKNPSF